MKKMYLLILMMFTMMILHGQSFERKCLIDIAGGYYSHKENVSIGGNDNELTIKSGKVSFGFNYEINKFLYLGLSLEYLTWIEKQDISYYNNDDGNNNTFILYNYPSLRNLMFLPSFNIKLFRNFSDKWVIGLNIKNGYGFINTRSENSVEMKVKYPTNIMPFKNGFNNKTDKSYYSLSFEPELMYFISDKICLKMQIVGYKFDTLNKSQFFCSSKTNEIFWSLGLGVGLK